MSDEATKGPDGVYRYADGTPRDTSAPVDDHETVRRLTALPFDPADLDRAVASQLAAHADPIKAELAEAYERVSTVIQWAHDLWDMFHSHFGGKLPMPVPPPKPGAGVE